MNAPNVITIEDNIKILLGHIISLLDLKILHSSLLVDMYDHLSPGKSIFDGVCHILNRWNVNTRSLPFDIEVLKQLPLPVLIFLYKDREDRRTGRFAILTGQDEAGFAILDTDQERTHLTNAELKHRCGNFVITLERKKSTNLQGAEYEQQIAVETNKIEKAEPVSVIMPIYNQSAFVQRALISLQLQTYKKWELILIDDGSKDGLNKVLDPFLKDKRIRYTRNKKNKGLGYCLNQGLDMAAHAMISYLPADDIYYSNHLSSMVEALAATGRAFAFSGIVSHFNNYNEKNYGYRATGQIPGYPLQLVQVIHQKTDRRWMERKELVTDDLNKMFWHNFLQHPHNVIGTREITCEWVDHSMQRHKIINDQKGGGIHLYKRTYGVSEPIRFQSSIGNYVDEIGQFEKFRYPAKAHTDKKDNLKILLVGELAFNAERICALEQDGHTLYGLWIDTPVNFNTIGPLPFGNVTDIPIKNWKRRIKDIKPDIIYALLNHHAVPLANYILNNNPGIPFVWHFKESPFHCRVRGTWPKLVNLYSQSDGQIYINETVCEWFQQFLPGSTDNALILDGDLPKIDWFTNDTSPLLSDKDNEIHTVIAGRPLGLSLDDIRQITEQRIHIHLYGEIFHAQFKEMIRAASRMSPNYIHLHSNCPQRDWVKEFSKYDAGWLHVFNSQNHGELLRADWNDLNFPARMSTYAMAGLPMLIRNNKGHRVACQEFLETENMALLFSSLGELKTIFENKPLIKNVRQNVWNKRNKFSFDYHVNDLVAFFREVIAKKTSDNLLPSYVK